MTILEFFVSQVKKRAVAERYFGSWGQALVAVAVVESFKQESMLWTVRRDQKKRGC